MLKTAEQKLKEDIAVAEKILTKTLGNKVRLEVGEKEGLSGRTYVHRLKVVQGPPEVFQTLIMKQARVGENQPYAPDALEGPASRLFNEWAGLQFLSEVCEAPLPAPSFYGGDRNAGLILMEDFGTGMRLDHALRDKDAAVAEKTMITLFETVGRMHAQSIGKQARYDELRNALGPTVRPPKKAIGKDLEGIRKSFKSISAKPQRGFYKEYETILKTLNEPGPFNAYIHSDPCPDNCHWVDSDLRLLDFESGKYSHALRDGVYPRIHFPTCWCVNRIPNDVTKRAEVAYRSELTKGCPEAADDRIFGPAVVGTCAYWAFATFNNWMPRILEKDQEWGIATLRQRAILRFELAAATAEEFGYLKAAGETARKMASKLRSLWSEVEEMPYYPAFQPQT